MASYNRSLAGGWVVSFLDLFSCALGAVLLLLVLTAAGRPPPGTGDRPPRAFLLVMEMPPDKRTLAEVLDGVDDQGRFPAPPGVDLPAPRWRPAGGVHQNGLLVVTGYLTDAAGRQVVVKLALKQRPVGDRVAAVVGDAKEPTNELLDPGPSTTFGRQRISIEISHPLRGQ